MQVKGFLPTLLDSGPWAEREAQCGRSCRHLLFDEGALCNVLWVFERCLLTET